MPRSACIRLPGIYSAVLALPIKNAPASLNSVAVSASSSSSSLSASTSLTPSSSSSTPPSSAVHESVPSLAGGGHGHQHREPRSPLVAETATPGPRASTFGKAHGGLVQLVASGDGRGTGACGFAAARGPLGPRNQRRRKATLQFSAQILDLGLACQKDQDATAWKLLVDLDDLAERFCHVVDLGRALVEVDRHLPVRVPGRHTSTAARWRRSRQDGASDT